jgi:hypothetical protein
MATDSEDFFYSLQCIINVFLIIRQNVRVIQQVKREIQTSNAKYYVNTGRLTVITMCIQCGLDSHLNLYLYRFNINRARALFILGRFQSDIYRV